MCGVGEKIGEKKRCIGRGGECIWRLSPSPNQLSIKQSRFKYNKWRKVWAKWDGREEEDELGGGREKGTMGVVGRGNYLFVDLEHIFCGACIPMRHRICPFCGASKEVRHRILHFCGAP